MITTVFSYPLLIAFVAVGSLVVVYLVSKYARYQKEWFVVK